jgi:hypothetical protein
MKSCTKCGDVKPYADFYAQKMNSKDGYQSHCKKCDNARKDAWKLKNPELAKSYSKKADANKYVKNKSTINKRNKTWKVENPGALQSMDARRRAAVLKRTPAWLSDFDHLRIKCRYEVAAMLNKHGVQRWHVDHIIPLQGKTVSGLHVPSNLQVITKAANLAKGNSFLE